MDLTNKRKKQTRALDVGAMIYGKIPPQARDFEEAVLGAMMVEMNAIDKIIDFMKPECFYSDAHQKIFAAMLALNFKSQPIDTLTVSEELRSKEELETCGGPYYIVKLTNHVTNSANVERHARIIYQKFMQRSLIAVGQQLVAEGFEDSADPFEMLDQAEGHLFQVSNAIHTKKYVGIDSLLVTAVKEIEAMRSSNQELSGVTSGYKSVDKITHGWQATDLVVLAARPGVGKTAFALNLARNAAMSGTPAAFFSLEMSAGQLIRRLMSSESGIALDKIQRGRMEVEDMKDLYSKAINKLCNAPLFIDDTPGLNVFELRAKARRLKAKENVGIIFIDYLQLMSGTGGHNGRNREQEISEISRNLKKLAKELNVPIIALSQLSRETEKRTNKEPILSDLRESGAIEQDADAVIFIYRPEYYGIHKDSAGESNPGETHLKFAKYRNGSPGLAKLRAQLWIQKFIDMDEVILKKAEDQKNNDGITTIWKKTSQQLDDTDTTFSNK